MTRMGEVPGQGQAVGTVAGDMAPLPALEVVPWLLDGEKTPP